MTESFFCEYTLRERLRELAALDQQLTRWGWFRRHEHHPPASGWRFRSGQALIRLGGWLQERDVARRIETLEKPEA